MLKDMENGPPAGWGLRIGIAAANLLPAFGVLALGWPAAPVVFLLWLEGLLGILELAAQAMVNATREEKAEKPDKLKGCNWAGWWAGMIIAVLGLSSPALVAGAGLYPLLERQAPGDPWLGILAGRGLPWAVAFAAVLWVFRILRFTGAGSIEPFRAAAPRSYALLLFRCVAMYGLAFMMRGLGRRGLGIFVLLASAALAFAELAGEDLLRRLSAAAGEAPRKGDAA